MVAYVVDCFVDDRVELVVRNDFRLPGAFVDALFDLPREVCAIFSGRGLPNPIGGQADVFFRVERPAEHGLDSPANIGGKFARLVIGGIGHPFSVDRAAELLLL